MRTHCHRIADALPSQSRADSISQAFERVYQVAGIENLTFHDLHHEATSRLFEKGLGLMEVASITGHKTVQMLKPYTHLRAADLVGNVAVKTYGRKPIVYSLFPELPWIRFA